MLLSVVKLCKEKLGASDGDIGHVKDFYFDDRNWAIRYLVADTGSWLSGRMVLISPRAFTNFYQGGKVLQVDLNKEQIEKSPSIELHKPVSRQYEEEYHRYYGWPYYWQDPQSRGISDFQITPPPPIPVEPLPLTSADLRESDDPHLRSAQAIIGYDIQASDEVTGHVTDFVMDDRDWSIKNLVLDTRNWLPGKRVMILPSQIKRISWDESKVYVDLTKEAILKAPTFDADSVNSEENESRISMKQE